MTHVYLEDRRICHFYENSTSTGLVYFGVFNDNSSNNGEVGENVVFNDNSFNDINGTIFHNAQFNDNSINLGLVYGDAYVASTATVPPSSVMGTIYNI